MESGEWSEIAKLLLSIFVFFVSFVIVGNFWNQHRRLFSLIDGLTGKLVGNNLLFLFCLALIPVFTRWVIQNPASAAPVAGYGIVYLFVNLTFNMLFVGVFRTKGEQARDERQRRRFHFNMLFMTVIIVGVILFALAAPQISAILLVGFPLATSFLQLWFGVDGNKDGRRGL